MVKEFPARGGPCMSDRFGQRKVPKELVGVGELRRLGPDIDSSPRGWVFLGKVGRAQALRSN